MSITYGLIRWDYGWCGSFKTVAEAFQWVGPADYVVAVENGKMRQLTAEEESEFETLRRATWHTKRSA